MDYIKSANKEGGVSDSIIVQHDTGLELLQSIWGMLEDGATITVERASKVDSKPYSRNFGVIKGGKA